MKHFIFGCIVAASLAGCSDDKDSKVAATGTVIGAVERADFCDTYAELWCSGNATCCDAPTGTFADSDSCRAAVECPSIINDALLDDGTLTYDSEAAGDFLRAIESRIQTCSTAEIATDLSFISGTIAAGAPCTPTSAAAMLSCMPGLSCVVEAPDGAAASATTGTCQTVATSVCADDDCDESAASEADAEDGNFWCQDEIEPPSNADWSNPDELCVVATNSSGGGTGADIQMKYLYDSHWYTCNITGGIDSGDTECCDPGSGSYTLADTDESKGELYVSTQSSDGLRITRVKVRKAGNTTASVGTWSRIDTGIDCDGCFLWWSCDQCWVDTSGHKNLQTARFMMSDESAGSSSYGWWDDVD